MMSWPLIKLGEVAEQITRAEPPLPGQEYRLLGVRLWGNGAYERETIDGSQTKYPKLFRVETGDIVVNKIWARNGSIAVIDDKLHGTFGSSEFPTYRTKADVLLPEWFRLFSMTHHLWEQCDTLSRGTSGQNRLRPSQFLEVLIPIPPLEEQRRIIRRIECAAELIARRSEAIAAAEAEMKQLLAKAFARCIDGAPRRPMSEVAPLHRRPVEIDPSQQYPELGARSFGRGIFHKPTLNGADLTWQSLFRVEAGDLVFSNIKAWEGAFAVAGPEDHGRFGSHRYLTCVPDARIMSSHFLWYYLQSAEGIEQVQAASPGSADRNRTLGQARLAKIMVPTPPLETQHWFEALQAKARRVQQLRTASAADIDTLMPSLLDEVFGKREAAT